MSGRIIGRNETHLVIHDLQIRMSYLVCKERRNTMDHLVEHRPQTPPVRLTSIATGFMFGYTRHIVDVSHFEFYQGFFVALQHLRGYVIASTTRNKAVFLGNLLGPVVARREQRSCRAKVDEQKPGVRVKNKVIGLDIASGYEKSEILATMSDLPMGKPLRMAPMDGTDCLRRPPH